VILGEGAVVRTQILLSVIVVAVVLQLTDNGDDDDDGDDFRKCSRNTPPAVMP